jgi:hypothetical protein
MTQFEFLQTSEEGNLLITLLRVCDVPFSSWLHHNRMDSQKQNITIDKGNKNQYLQQELIPLTLPVDLIIDNNERRTNWRRVFQQNGATPNATSFKSATTSGL